MSDPPGDEIPYSFRDENLLIEALEAAGASLRPEGNKRLALIGDAVLRLIICLYGYTQGWSTGENVIDLT
jgi:dsRNA-specific ribonuclease